jgi:pimeloyl-ACP methyl ester carboxylesterase
LRASGLVYLDAVGDRTVPMPPMPSIRSAQPSPADRRSIKDFQTWQQTAMGMAFPESELRQVRAIGADGSVGVPLVPEFVPRAIFAGVKRPDYSRMRIPALSLQSLPPASVAEGRATNTLIPGMFPGASDSTMNEVFAAIRKVTRANTDVFEKALKGSRNVELIGASHYNFLSHPDDVLREVRGLVKTLETGSR